MKQDYVYFVQDKTGLVKVGRSIQPWYRISCLEKCYGPLMVLRVKPVDDRGESYYHEAFSEFRYPPRLGDGGTEWFDLPHDFIEAITNYGIANGTFTPNPAFDPSYITVSFEVEVTSPTVGLFFRVKAGDWKNQRLPEVAEARCDGAEFLDCSVRAIYGP
jgi:hypothetical protein